MRPVVIEHGTPRHAQAVRMREEHLRKPLGFTLTAEEVAKEVDSYALGLVEGDALTATCVLVPLEDRQAKVRQVIVDPARQGQGLGRQIMRFAEGFALGLGFSEIVLNARLTAVEFYRRIGYITEGAEFLEVLIPHLKMRRMLPATTGYAAAFPEDLRYENKLAIWPIGALEWHGSHLPLGTDGYLAEAFSRHLARRTGGVLMPTCWLPITTLPHSLSLEVGTETFRGILADSILSLKKAGFNRLVIMTGHYAQGHLMEVLNFAEQSDSEMTVVAGTPLQPLGDDDMLDHAGAWETAQMLLLGPEGAARLNSLPDNLEPKKNAVLGEHPKKADLLQCNVAIERALNAWAELLEPSNGAKRSQFNDQIRLSNASYIQLFYRNSWQQAIADWWDSKRPPV